MGHRQVTVVALLLVAGPQAVCGKICDGTKDKVPCSLLHSGTSIPQIAMGTWGGSYKDCDRTDFTCIKQQASFAVNQWLHIGGRHIDSANNYRTQTVVGDALQASGLPRDEVFLTTKCPGPIGYAATMQCAEDNLQMLNQYGTTPGYIDLLLIHWPWGADKAGQQDTWRAMEDLKRSGKVKAIGVSNYNITDLKLTMEKAREPIDLNQVEWNPKTHDDELLSFCREHGIQLQAYSPLGGKAGSVLGETDVVKIAKTHGVSTAQVVLRWSLQRGVVLVVGTANGEHIRGDIDIFSFNLTQSEVDTISKLSARSIDNLLV